MTQTTIIPEYRYSDRGRIQQGDTFRARGGPTYKGTLVGQPGLYRLLAVEQCRQRTCLVAVRLNRHGLQSGGVSTLYVGGAPYRLKSLPDWIVRPYRVSLKRD